MMESINERTNYGRSYFGLVSILTECIDLALSRRFLSFLSQSRFKSRSPVNRTFSVADMAMTIEGNHLSFLLYSFQTESNQIQVKLPLFLFSVL